MRYEGNSKSLEPNPAWVSFFSYVRSMGDGVISRVVIQDKTPIFMEHATEGVDLTANGNGYFPNGSADAAATLNDYSPEWSKLVKIAWDLSFCEFHDLKIKNGVPVSIGKLVSKKKFA